MMGTSKAWAPLALTRRPSTPLVVVEIKIVFKSVLYKNVTGVVCDYYETNHD